jgi:glutamyl-tRNA synthetase/glutamyl-Q tRNA(Asp) synthetase
MLLSWHAQHFYCAITCYDVAQETKNMTDTLRPLEKLKAAIETIPTGSTTRFAPSPTGYLHLGHVAAALFVWIIGKKTQSKILFRMEDHDLGRYRPEYDLAITEDLIELGFVPDEGIDLTRKVASYRQSTKGARYQSLLESLVKAQKAYGCECSRKDIHTAMEIGAINSDELVYLGQCRNKNIDPNQKRIGTRARLSKEPISIDDLWLGPLTQTASEQCGDLLLRDRQGYWTYQFCCVVDDYDQGVDLIIRGQDLAHCVGRQIHLAQILGFKACNMYLHHPLITNPSGHKLSKRFLSTSIRQMMREGQTKQAIIGRAAYLMGFQPDDKPISLNDLIGNV